MKLKHVGVISCGKVFGVLHGGLCLIFCAIFSLIAFMGTAFGSDFTGGAFGTWVGVIVMLPLFYGILGFIGGIITAWLYNIVTGWTGGIEMEFDTTNNTPSQPDQTLI